MKTEIVSTWRSVNGRGVVVERSDKERDEKNEDATVEEAAGFGRTGVDGEGDRCGGDPVIAARNS